ncbi:MAG TPA: VCBS repeat-containing protein, partial [Planctomycetota bacterium]|nr:VCBS repeat-containing protein [Planctomycetota bacterium]
MRIPSRAAALATAVAATGACSRDDAASRATARFWFVDVTEESGLASFTQENGNREKPFILESVGGGVALFDYDGDGWLDAYFTNGGSLEGFPPGREPRDALYRNRGDATFEDVTARAGLGDAAWTCAVAAADVDGDGWTDLYLANWGPNVLLRNRGDGTFVDVTAASCAGDPRWSAGVCFFDYDRDGDLDLYVANYVEFARDEVAKLARNTYRGVSVYLGPKGLRPAPDALYRNEGGCVFRDVTEAAGIHDRSGFGFQPVAFDPDEDGDLD